MNMYNRILNLISNNNQIDINSELDRKISKAIINAIDIPYFNLIDKTQSMTNLDVLGIRTHKISNFYLVEENDNVNIPIKKGDLILEGVFDISDYNAVYTSNIKYITEDNEGYHFKSFSNNINLKLAKEKEIFYFIKPTYYYNFINFDSFSGYKNIKQKFCKNARILIDFRNNKGGCLKDIINFFNMFNYKLSIVENDESIDFKIVEKDINDSTYFIFVVNEATASTAEIIIKICQEYFYTKVAGKNTFGKNIICRNEYVNNLLLRIPYKEATINASSFTKILPDQFISNIDYYKFCELKDLELNL